MASSSRFPTTSARTCKKGTATLSVQLPEDCNPGEELHFLAIVTDPTRTEAFDNRFVVKVKPPVDSAGGSGTRRKPPAKDPGKDRDATAGITLPNIIMVHEADWEKQSPPFDKHTALRIKDAGSDEATGGNGHEEEKATVYDFYVNMDNLYLRSEMKPASADPELLRNRFIYGNVLLGLALLHQEELDKKARRDRKDGNGGENEDEQQTNIEDRVAQFTRAVAPVLLPMVEALGGIDAEELATADSGAGESV